MTGIRNKRVKFWGAEGQGVTKGGKVAKIKGSRYNSWYREIGRGPCVSVEGVGGE